MGSKTLVYPQYLSTALEQIEVYDHFNYYVDADLWTKAVVGTGTVAHAGDDLGTTVKLFCTAANDAAVLPTTNELFKFTASKEMRAKGLITFTDVNTDDGHVFFGWADALAATTMADSTGAITATDACCIYKLPDTTVWAFHTEINTSATASVSTTTAGGTSQQELEIRVTPRSSTVFEARPFVDGVQLKTSAGVAIMHTITLGTATAMDFGAMTKSNHANDFNVYVDLLYAAQVK